MSGTKDHVLAAAAILFLCSCSTTVSLSSIQSEYLQLERKQQDCRQSMPEEYVPLLDCLAPLDQALLDIARQVESSAPKGEPMAQIAALRIGSVAACRAGAPGHEIAARLSDRGEVLCSKMFGDTGPMSRDCFILGFVPLLIAHQRWSAALSQIESAPLQEQEDVLRSFAVDYRPATWDLLTSRPGGLELQSAMDPALRSFAENCKRVFYCTVAEALAEFRRLQAVSGNAARLNPEYEALELDWDRMSEALGREPVDCEAVKRQMPQ
jgi:hypothetical protein